MQSININVSSDEPIIWLDSRLKLLDHTMKNILHVSICDECDCSSLLVRRNTDDGRSKQMEPVTIPSAGHHWLCTHRWAFGTDEEENMEKASFL